MVVDYPSVFWFAQKGSYLPEVLDKLNPMRQRSDVDENSRVAQWAAHPAELVRSRPQPRDYSELPPKPAGVTFRAVVR